MFDWFVNHKSFNKPEVVKFDFLKMLVTTDFWFIIFDSYLASKTKTIHALFIDYLTTNLSIYRGVNKLSRFLKL